MGWKLKFDAPVGCRSMKDCFNWVQVHNKSDDQPVMWNPTGTRFFDSCEKTKDMPKSNCLRGVNSVKAFKRFLRKNGDNLKEYEVVLCSKYWLMDSDNNFLYDYSITAEWEE